MSLSRRGFILGLGAALAAPAIVRAEIIMPVRKMILPAPVVGNLVFLSTPHPSDPYAAYAARVLTETLKGFGLTYEQLTARWPE